MVQYMIVEIKKSLSFWTSYRPHVYDILAISVEDNVQYCQDANELAIIKEEGCTGGAFWRAVNTIADAVGPDFPSISFLADACVQSTRPLQLSSPLQRVFVV